MRLVIVLVAWVAATPGAAALSLLPASSADAPAVHAFITDPAGDARIPPAQTERDAAIDGCSLVNETLGRACASAPNTYAARDAGEPAPPGTDILAIDFADSPDSLVVTETLASLDEASWAGGGRTADQWGTYFLCWGEKCKDGRLYALAQPDGRGGVRPNSFFSRSGKGCEASYCSWGVDLQVTYGSPGTLGWTIPRELLADPNAPLHAPAASTGLLTSSALFSAEPAFGLRTFTSDAVTSGGQGAYYELYDGADNSPPVDYAFRTAFAGVRGSALPSDDQPAQTFGAPVPSWLSLDKASLIETPSTLTVATRFDTLQPSPQAFVAAAIGIEGIGQAGAYATLNATGIEQAYPYVFERSESKLHVIDAAVNVTLGSPGWFNVTIPRSEIGSPARGTRLDFLAGTAEVFDHRSLDDPLGDRVVAGQEQGGAISTAFASLGRLQLDTKAPTTSAQEFTDPAGDARLPTGTSGSAATYDITGLTVRGLSPTQTKLTLSVADLQDIAVPTSARGILYAVGIQTDAGSFMAGYWKSAAAATSPGQQQYFCSQDEDVLTQVKHDPQEAVWTPISGILTFASAGVGSGGPAAGTISLIVPHACFGVESEGTVHVKRIAAGSYIVSAGATPVTGAASEVDHLEGGTDVVMGAAIPQPAPAPFWLAPFGIDQFWNIAGVATALAGGLFAVAARQRRRNALAREMRAIDAAHQKNRENEPAWRAAMAEIRARCAEKLRAGKLRPDEVLVVERRIDLLAADVVAAPPAPKALDVGSTLLERYQLTRLLGEGGQGRAWLAHDTVISRDVVVKILATGGLDPNAKRLVLAEARLAGSISHPNVVRVLDVREVDGQAVLILEYVEGGTLRSLLARRGKLGAREAVTLYKGILAGLAAAHERGIVHRDVKPENVLLGKDGTAKLADFGAARESRADATVVAQAAGTLAYMSPEQARGANADARSDLYSAAAVLVEMLTGDSYLPLRGADEFQARALILERAPELRLPNDALRLTGVIVRSLAKKPSERYQSVEETLAALDHAGA